MSNLAPMHNPPHPGTFITEAYLEPLGISARELAAYLDVSPSTVTRLLNATSHLTPVMAARLSQVLGSTPRFWLNLQTNYDLHQTRNLNLNLTRLPHAS